MSLLYNEQLSVIHLEEGDNKVMYDLFRKTMFVYEAFVTRVRMSKDIINRTCFKS